MLMAEVGGIYWRNKVLVKHPTHPTNLHGRRLFKCNATVFMGLVSNTPSTIY